VINVAEIRERVQKIAPLVLVAILPGGIFLAPLLLMRRRRAARRST
jgi:hypothetical protein